VAYPPLLCLPTEADYQRHFEAAYCRATIMTFDGIRVFFPLGSFQHAFFKSQRGKRATKTAILARERAERMDWIAAALKDPSSERYEGWDKRSKTYDPKRRVTLVQGDYVVVIQLNGPGRAFFVTAFVADSPATLAAIRTSPVWR
jgi:hypothetical protein